MMELINNVDKTLKDDLCVELKSGSSVSIAAACFSIYAFKDKILKGFITTKDGIRIGLSGELVVDNGKIVTLKNFTSLNIRLSREVFGASDFIYNKVFNEELYNTLIVAPPFSGKTTILKDLIRRINLEKIYY